ncbi:MAG: transketolase C-terminal domain-containing protein [Planctomycetota bacterium]
MRDAFANTLTELAASDPRIMLLTGDLGFGVFHRFRDLFSSRFINAGVAEQNMMGLATGLALEGRIVFTYSIGNFGTLRCLEHIRNDVCFHDANVKVVSVGAGFSYGALGISHHATEDLAIMRSLPNMVVVSPCDVWEAREGTRAIAARQGPAFLRLDKSVAPTAQRDGEPFCLGRARVIRAGWDVTLMATGGILAEALWAADKLAGDGISCRVLSIHTVKPIDLNAIRSAARETAGIVTVEEHTVEGGLGSAVAEVLLEAGDHPGFFTRIGLRAGFSSIVGSQQYLRAAYGMDAGAIIGAVVKLLKSKPVRILRRPAEVRV